ncbi:hypothetical protein AGMMS49950_08580 [Endomicrobiia bacterium]|nr:hypothetical protein AGMMS49531_10030 [Endomicrobiia bacterium]GHT71621.1 hypothetical protein AGMMS49950_08580 [Endomicrobiia bacterium]
MLVYNLISVQFSSVMDGGIGDDDDGDGDEDLAKLYVGDDDDGGDEDLAELLVIP